MTQPLTSLVRQVAKLLGKSQTRIVFAESCTGGLVSAMLARVPGISEFHCGSAVVYRLDTKTRWLGISETMLRDVGAVSSPVARSMAIGVLERTPEADLSAAITGHLGPDAPADQDGLVFIALARRGRPGGHCTKRGSDPQPRGDDTDTEHNGKGADPVFVQSRSDELAEVAVFERRLPAELSEFGADDQCTKKEADAGTHGEDTNTSDVGKESVPPFLVQSRPESLREWRQWKAAELVLSLVRDELLNLSPNASIDLGG